MRRVGGEREERGRVGEGFFYSAGETEVSSLRCTHPHPGQKTAHIHTGEKTLIFASCNLMLTFRFMKVNTA